MGNHRKQEIICRCNNISRQEIEQAIRDGARTMNEIFDSTTAGVGACGGTCRWVLKPFLDAYLRTGKFRDVTPPRPKGK